MLLVGVSGLRAAEAYVYLDTTDGCLYFCYDNNRSSRKFTTYDLNTGKNEPKWSSIADQVKTACFTTGFANYTPTTCYRWFAGMQNLTNVAYITRLNTSKVTCMQNMFGICNSLTSLNLSNFNTANVTDMSSMFLDCRSLTSLNLSNFNTANVIRMDYMFYNCRSLTSLNVSNFNTANVTNMTLMFDDCKSLTSLNLSNFNTAKVEKMRGMFYGCRSLTSLNVSKFNTAKVTDMVTMFYGCSSLTSLNLSSFTLPAYSTEMMNGCTSLNSLTVPSSGNTLSSDACLSVGTPSSPCTLYYPTSLHPDFTSVNPDYVVWKSGYFKSNNIKPYAVYASNALTFYYDDYSASRTGTVYNLNTGSNVPGWNSNATSVKSVTFNSNFANARPASCFKWFSGMTSLTSFSGLTYLNTSKVTTMANMFEKCSSLKSLDLNLSNFITSSVTSMAYMFSGCTNLASLSISNFNTANVTNMAYMFNACSALTSLNISKFNTAKVTNMAYMFNGCSALTNLSSGLYTQNVTNMAYMFNKCSKLASINIANFNTAKVTNMACMFNSCSSLASIDVSKFNTAKVTDMSSMFGGCSKLSSLNLSSFTIPANTSGMMKGCTSLNSLTVPSSDNSLSSDACQSVGTQSSPCTLYYPTSLHPDFTSVNPDYVVWKSGYFKSNNIKPYAVYASNALTFYYDDYSASRTGTVYNLNTGSNVPGWNSNATSVKSVTFNSNFANARPASCFKWFSGMTSLTSFSGLTYLNTSKVTTMANMFEKCSSLKSLDLNLSNFITSSVTSMAYMFSGCTNLASLSISNFNTANVTNMAYMFNACSALTSLNISKFNTAKVTNMAYMFNGCSALTNLSSGLYTQNVTNMAYMFNKCSKLASINIANFNTAKVTNMACMFNSCSSLASIDVSKFNTAKVTDMSSMFGGCSKLSSLNLSNFTIPANTSGMMKGCTSLSSLTVPSSGNTLSSDACGSVGTPSSPCTLYYPTSLHPDFTSVNPDYVVWKSGYFKSNNIKPYAVYASNALTFYYDDYSASRTGTVYNLNTGSNVPGWNSNATSVKSVTFNSNFANARPASCFKWFSGMTNLTSLSGFTYLNTSKVTTLENMFEKCSSVKSLNLNLSTFSTTNVTSMAYMFSGCTNLASLSFPNFNTSKVTSMAYMFNGCSKLSSLNLSSFTIPANTSGMMKGCTSLSSLTVPSSGNTLSSDACEGVGTKAAPSTLVYPEGFKPEKTSMGKGWYMWKSGYFKETGGIRGDANGDGKVSLIDVIITVEYYLGNNPQDFIFTNAEMDDDDEISLSDLLVIVDIILNQ